MVGCTTKGFYICPMCGRNTYSIYLNCSRKCVYMGQRKYIPINHRYRSQKGPFNGNLSITLHLKSYECHIFLQKHKERKRIEGRVKVNKERETVKKLEIQMLSCGRKGQFYSIFHIGRYVHTLSLGNY